MSRAEAFVTEARRWIGTPFAPQQAARGIGADCWGVLAGAAAAAGLRVAPWTPYSMLPSDRLTGELEARFHKLAPPWRGLARLGDIVHLRHPRERYPYHVGIFTHSGLIHSNATTGGCIEEPMTDTLWYLTRGVYRFPELAR